MGMFVKKWNVPLRRIALSAETVLQGFPVVIEIPVRWGDMDSFGHVNNTIYFRYFESARIAYLESLDYRAVMEATGIGPILASTACIFKIPLEYPDTVRVGARVSEVGADRFTMEYAVFSERSGGIAASGDGVVVSYDYTAKAKAPLPEALRAGIAGLEKTG